MNNYEFHNTHLFKSLWHNDYGYRDLYKTGSSRTISGLCAIHYLIRYFNPSNILEIGYSEGMTFMAMMEASHDNASLTAVDIELDVSQYNNYYQHHCGNRQISLVETPSQMFTPKGIYNFINIDGNHSYPQALIDMALIKDHIDANTIIMIDDYNMDEVDIAISDFIKLELGFVPFLLDFPAVYFHHETHDASEFIDKILPHYFYSLSTLYSVSYKGYDVRELKFWPSIKKDIKTFSLICDRLKI